MSFWLTFAFDASSQGTLDRLTTALNNLNTTIGARLMTTISDLEAAATAVATANSTLATAITGAVSEFPALAARIADLTAQLAAAVASGNDPAIQAVTAQLNTASAQLTQEATDLKTAADAAASALPPPPAQP